LCTPLIVGAAMARGRLRLGAAQCGGHADVALPRGVVTLHSPCPLSRCRPRGCAGRVKTVNVGHHQIIREAGLSTGVYCGVPLHELPPAQRFVSAGLEGEVGEVLGGEPKMLLCRVWPQHADNDVIRESSNEGLVCRSPREDIGVRRPAEGTAATGSTGPV
jgi:hypothetical protein